MAEECPCLSFRGPRRLDSSAIASSFSQYGKVIRVLRESTTTTVDWQPTTETYNTFPQVVVDTGTSLPVEVILMGSFGSGEGEQLFRRSALMQAAHATIMGGDNESSAKVANTDFSKGDATAMYTFSVAKKDLVFHRHAGHRAITAITGAAGAVLKFSGATAEEADRDPLIFVDKLFFIELPPDSLFILRFDGTVYHQFCPKDHTKDAFFAISVHTNEAGGLSGDLLEIVKANNASIPLLSDPIKQNVASLLDRTASAFVSKRVPVTTSCRFVLSDSPLAPNSQSGHSRRNLLTFSHSPHSPHTPYSFADDECSSSSSDGSKKIVVPVFVLPRLVRSYSDPLDTFYVEFAPEGRKAVLAQALEHANNHSLTVEGVGIIQLKIVTHALKD